MSTATEFSKEFYQHSQRFFSERVEYTAVTALLLYWKENDISPEQELDAIRELFQTDFGFTSLTFPIPSQSAQLELNREITAFVARCSNRVDTLILVYYAGHGDMDENGDGVWAANEVEGPTLSWKAVQQLLYHAVGDVLVILDCCSAALVSKGQKKEGKFEILGASAKGSRTPEPGKSSFTSILIKHIRKSMRKAPLINVRSLHGELLENGQLTETPQYADLARSTPRSIVLQPLRSLEHEGFIKKPSSFLMLKISLAEDPTGLRIAEWLKAHPPDGVTAVSVEALILKARRLQGLVDQTVFPPGSMFGKLSEGAQRELLRRLQGLDTVLQSANNSAQSFLKPEVSVITNSIEAIDQSVNAVCKAIETPMLLDPHFPEGTGKDRDEHHDLAWAVGAEDSLSLRRHLLSISAIPDNLNLPRDALLLPRLTNPAQRSARFKRGTLKEKDVLVESVPYGTWDDGSSQGQTLPSKLEVDQIERMTALLSQSKNASFHILPCVGYISEPVNRIFGFVFETPPKSNLDAEPVPLRQLYKLAKIVPLGHRIRLAHELIAALENFHRVGWVHKNISSHNIMFLPRLTRLPHTSASINVEKLRVSTQEDPISIDLASPWLFGFDASRPEEAHTHMREDHSLSNNIYRHPARWGRPNLRFTKPHDVYSLGVVLLEIAFWKDVISLAEIPSQDTSHKTHPLVAEDVRATLSAKCNRMLPHQVGKSFTDTILSCLDFEKHTKDLGPYELHRYYDMHVVEKIAKAVGRV